MFRILCICKGDRCRSPMYAAVLRRRLLTLRRHDVSVESAGYWPGCQGKSAARAWIELEHYTRIDLRSHRSRWVGDLDIKAYDKLIFMDIEAREKTRVLARFNPDKAMLASCRDGGVPDPSDIPNFASEEHYVACYDYICRLVGGLALPPLPRQNVW